jgi:hypothetical protein
MPQDTANIIKVSLNTHQPPNAGAKTVLVRLTDADHADIQKAGDIVGLKQAEFYRTCVIQSARQIIADNPGKRRRR